MGWIIALALIAGAMFVPLGIRASYGENGALVLLTVGPGRILLYPKQKKPTRKGGTPAGKTAQRKTESQKGGDISGFFPLVRAILEFLVDFRSKLRVQLLQLKVVLAGGDPSDLAVNYGKTKAAIEGLMPQVERFFVIKNKDVDIACDFLADTSSVYARLDLTITVGRLLGLAVCHGKPIIREFLKIVKFRKGGARS